MTLLASLYAASPDIEEIEVTEDLEFVLMACDGERVCVHVVYVCACVCARLPTVLATVCRSIHKTIAVYVLCSVCKCARPIV